MPFLLPLYQGLPFGSSSTVCGKAPDGNCHSFISPVRGSRRPMMLPNCPTHQIVAVLGLDRIARALAERRHHPFLEGDLVRPGHQLGGAPVVLGRIVFGEISGDRGLLVRHAPEIDHRADQFLPAFARVARALRDHVGLMAAGADTVDQLLARAVRQRGRRGLRLRGQREQQAQRGSRCGQVQRSRHISPPNRIVVIRSPMVVPAGPLVKQKAR